MKAKKLLALILALMLMAALMVGCNSNQPVDTPTSAPIETSSANDDEPLPVTEANPVAVDKWVIPVVAAVTGTMAHAGESAVWAAKYAADKINAEGGIRGVPVEVVIHDTEFTPAVGAQVAARVADTNPIFMVGCISAPVSQAIGQVISEEKIPNVGSYTFDGIRSDFAPYAYGYMSDSATGDLDAAINWCKIYGYKEIVLFYTPSDTSMAQTKVLFERDLEKLAGVKVLGYVEVEAGTLDAGPAAVQALGYGAEAYFVCLRADEAGKVINELRSRGVDSTEKMHATFAAMSSATLLDVLGENAEGLNIWNKMDLAYSGADWQQLLVDFNADFGSDPTTSAVPGFYNAILAFKYCVEELEITGDPAKLQEERDAIANWFYNSPDLEGVQGTYKWVDGELINPAYSYIVRDGKYVSRTVA